jgi:predicted acetyltransferase
MALSPNDKIKTQLSFSRIPLSDRPRLESLLQIYLSELSRYSPIKQSPSGEYVYPYLQYYWQDRNRHPYFLLRNEEICGFALIREDMNPSNGEAMMDLAEFYIQKNYRRLNIGSRIVEMLWDQYPTSWHLSILKENQTARAFWSAVINHYTMGTFTLQNKDHDTTISYYFDSRSFRT